MWPNVNAFVNVCADCCCHVKCVLCVCFALHLSLVGFCSCVFVFSIMHLHLCMCVFLQNPCFLCVLFWWASISPNRHLFSNHTICNFFSSLLVNLWNFRQNTHHPIALRCIHHHLHCTNYNLAESITVSFKIQFVVYVFFSRSCLSVLKLSK